MQTFLGGVRHYLGTGRAFGQAGPAGVGSTAAIRFQCQSRIAYPLTFLRANADYALRTNSINKRENSLHDIINEVDYVNQFHGGSLLLLSALIPHRLTLVLNEPV